MESFLMELKKDVQCSLCNDTLTEPKVLPCFHIFCKPCIKRHAELMDDVNVFKCPRCKSQTPLPEPSSVEDLQPSPIHSRILKGLALVEGEKVCSVSESHSSASWYCFDCDRSMCDECQKYHSEFIKDHKVVRLADLTKQDIELIITRENPCPSHPQHRLELFCEDCADMICRTCLIHHKDHKTIPSEKFAEIKKGVFLSQLQVLEQLRQDEKARQQQVDIAKTIKEQGEKAKEGVKDTANEMMQVLQENEGELLKRIDEKLDTATTNLNIIHHIPAAKKHIKNLMERGLASEMLNNHETKCSEKFIFDPIPLSSGIAFIPNQKLAQQVNTGLGQIQTHFETYHTKSNILVEDEPSENKQKEEQGWNIKFQEMRITGRFHMEDKKRSPLCGIAVNTDNSKIALAFLKSEVYGYPVFVLNANGSILKTFSQSSTHLPNCIAFLNNADLVLVTNTSDHGIRIVNTISGRSLKTFRHKNFAVEESCYYCGVHVDDVGNIIVCDRENHRVQVFTRDGDYQYQFGLTSKAMVFDNP